MCADVQKYFAYVCGADTVGAGRRMVDSESPVRRYIVLAWASTALVAGFLGVVPAVLWPVPGGQSLES